MNLHFVRFIRGLQNFLAIPIMNTLAGFMISSINKMDSVSYTYWVDYYSHSDKYTQMITSQQSAISSSISNIACTLFRSKKAGMWFMFLTF